MIANASTIGQPISQQRRQERESQSGACDADFKRDCFGAEAHLDVAGIQVLRTKFPRV